jgi:GntR family transcriptional regulator, transcriptional repressor for pyruvate dehydrogenase complex
LNDLFQPLDHAPAYRQIAQLIEGKIIGRTLKAGDALPSETDLARQFGVNRSTVREAIRELESHGLLGRRSGAKRLRVTRPEPQRISSGMSRALALHDVTFFDLWEAMMAIEPAAAEHAAERRSAAQLTALRRAAERFRHESAGTAAAVADVVDFFSAIAEASQNQVLEFAQAPLNRLLTPTLMQMIDCVPQARTRIVNAQARILSAVKLRKGAEAREWMAKHIRDFRRGYELAGISLQYRVSG